MPFSPWQNDCIYMKTISSNLIFTNLLHALLYVMCLLYILVRCAQCAGPPEACEVAFYEDTCDPPNHYCINHVTNLASGDRLVERK